MLTACKGLMIPFGLVWGGVAVFWEVCVLRTEALPPTLLFGAVFVVIGLFMIGGRFVLDAMPRSTIVDALTDRQVLIARGGPWSGFKAQALDRPPEAGLSEEGGGRGTIRLATPARL